VHHGWQSSAVFERSRNFLPEIKGLNWETLAHGLAVASATTTAAQTQVETSSGKRVLARWREKTYATRAYTPDERMKFSDRSIDRSSRRTERDETNKRRRAGNE